MSNTWRNSSLGPTYLSLPPNPGQRPLVWVLSGSSPRGRPVARIQCRKRGVRPGIGTSAVGSQLQQDLLTSIFLHLHLPHAPHSDTHPLGSKSLPRAHPDSSRSLLSTASLSLSGLPSPCRQREALCCHIKHSKDIPLPLRKTKPPNTAVKPCANSPPALHHLPPSSPTFS